MKQTSIRSSSMRAPALRASVAPCKLGHRATCQPIQASRRHSPPHASSHVEHGVTASSKVGAAVAGMVLAVNALLGPVPGSLPLFNAPAAHAYTVRLDQVENPKMQEGVWAATQGQLSRAEKIFLSMLEEDSSSLNSASTWSNLGNVHMSMGRTADAAQDYSRAIALAPDAPVPYLNRAIALEQLGVDIQEAGGQQEQARQRWQEAEADCEAAISRDSQEFAAWFNKGNVEMRLGDYTGAQRSFRTAADLAPGIAGYRLREAQLIFENGDADLAVRTARGVTRRNPNYAEAHATLAAILYEQGDVARAEDEYHTAVELEPSFRYMDFVKTATRWPPHLYTAFSRFLALGS
mmetsp:Transcript_39763/g.88383  ORF Transcript_39763/g.88383 Transcript_39763/m.88383 type:complete len:350 (+) Transcript_39763:169-1218(+)